MLRMFIFFYIFVFIFICARLGRQLEMMLYVCFVRFGKLMFSPYAFFRNKALMFHGAVRPDWSVKPNLWIGVSPSFDQFSY
jgi:hypothetical protein